VKLCLILENILWCFWAPHAEKRPKNAIKKSRWEKTKGKKFFFSQLFRPKVFDMDFPQKVLNGVFELPLLRNAQKRHKSKSQIKKKEKRKAPTYPICGHLPDIRRFQFSFSLAPLATVSHCGWMMDHHSPF
jgi:hypothetical protein